METLSPIGSGEYKYFSDKADRDELFMFTKEICEYLKKKNIDSVVLVDRAIRPAYIGISEYWKAKYPGEKKPDIYFINPLGLKSRESMKPGDMGEILKNAVINEDIIDLEARAQNTINEDFKKTYKNLIEKDDRVLILDACVHTGWQIGMVKDALEKGRKEKRDILLGALSIEEGVEKPDFYLKKHLYEKDCHPFGEEKLMAKTLSSVCSVKSEKKENIKEAREARDEIRRIIREHLNVI